MYTALIYCYENILLFVCLLNFLKNYSGKIGTSLLSILNVICLLGTKVVLMTAAHLWIQYQLHSRRNCLSSHYCQSIVDRFTGTCLQLVLCLPREMCNSYAPSYKETYICLLLYKTIHCVTHIILYRQHKQHDTSAYNIKQDSTLRHTTTNTHVIYIHHTTILNHTTRHTHIAVHTQYTTTHTRQQGTTHTAQQTCILHHTHTRTHTHIHTHIHTHHNTFTHT